jgi:hypothetical protein
VNERQTRELVYARAGGRCELSGAIGPAMSYHHRKKKSHLKKGQQWCPSNVVYVTGSGTTEAHGWIESHPADAEKLGFHVRPWQTPGDTPIRHAQFGWVLLLPDGGFVEVDSAEGGDISGGDQG